MLYFDLEAMLDTYMHGDVFIGVFNTYKAMFNI